MPWPYIPRRAAAVRLARAAAEGAERAPQRSAETFLLLPIRRCFARLPRRPAPRVRRPERPLCRTPPSRIENSAFARILIKITRISRSAAGTSDGKRENVLIPRKPPPLAVFVCRGYNDMRQKNQTRRAEDAGDKAARTCRKADAALSAVNREAQARLYRQQWQSLKRGAVKAAVRRSTDCRYIHRRRKRCEGDAAIAGRPRRPPNRRSTAPKPALYNVEKSVSGANATVPIHTGAAAGLRAVTAKATRNSALLVRFFAALPSGLPSGGGYTAISLCFLQPAST